MMEDQGQNQDLREKKLRGSGGYVLAHITDEEQKKGNLGGPELFLAGIGRLPSDRLVKYHCNKCDKDYQGSPNISFENPNEDLGEGVTLFEKGEYKCKTCKSIIAQYRKFDAPEESEPKEPESPEISTPVEIPDTKNSDTVSETTIKPQSSASIAQNEFISIQSLVGMPAYDWDAMLIGKVQEIGLKRTSKGKMEINLKIPKKSNNQNIEVAWKNISKIGDIILLENSEPSQTTQEGQCPHCNFQNESDAVFCSECGKKINNE
ncbi:MAG TPA: zinc-ribbon domain-containing protein [Nitrososphaeraceae archaeon]|nr:zinc-ribbon domain-containing protein [Nitrososphaeraceae archaeon]